MAKGCPAVLRVRSTQKPVTLAPLLVSASTAPVASSAAPMGVAELVTSVLVISFPLASSFSTLSVPELAATATTPAPEAGPTAIASPVTSDSCSLPPWLQRATVKGAADPNTPMKPLSWANRSGGAPKVPLLVPLGRYSSQVDWTLQMVMPAPSMFVAPHAPEEATSKVTAAPGAGGIRPPQAIEHATATHHPAQRMLAPLRTGRVRIAARCGQPRPPKAAQGLRLRVIMPQSVTRSVLNDAHQRNV